MIYSPLSLTVCFADIRSSWPSVLDWSHPDYIQGYIFHSPGGWTLFHNCVISTHNLIHISDSLQVITLQYITLICVYNFRRFRWIITDTIYFQYLCVSFQFHANVIGTSLLQKWTEWIWNLNQDKHWILTVIVKSIFVNGLLSNVLNCY